MLFWDKKTEQFKLIAKTKELRLGEKWSWTIDSFTRDVIVNSGIFNDKVMLSVFRYTFTGGGYVDDPSFIYSIHLNVGDIFVFGEYDIKLDKFLNGQTIVLSYMDREAVSD